MTNINKISEHFWDALIDAGSLVVECEFCGRLHFAHEGDYEAGELERLEANAKKTPDKYVEHFDRDVVSWGYLDGKQAVYNCPCESLVRWEQFIWNERDMILKYYKARMKTNSKNAQADLEKINGL